MLIKKLLDANFDNALTGGRPTPRVVPVPTGEVIRNAGSATTDQAMARRLRRERRMSRRNLYRGGGWLVKAW